MISRKTFAVHAAKKISLSTPGPSPSVKTTTVTPQGSITMPCGERIHHHTPGPWCARRNIEGKIVLQAGPWVGANLIAMAGTGCPEHFPGDPECNMRIAAAAPDMLERLESVAALLTAIQSPVSMGKFCEIGHELWEIRHLIGKATGGAA